MAGLIEMGAGLIEFEGGAAYLENVRANASDNAERTLGSLMPWSGWVRIKLGR